MDTVGVQEAAKILRTGHNEVRARIRDGRLKAAQIGAGYVLLRQDVLDHLRKEVEAQTAKRAGVPLSSINKRSRNHLRG